MAKRMLVVYWSFTNGNTGRVARRLAEACGADVEELEPRRPYRGSHEAVVEQGKREVEEGFLPELAPLAAHLDDYDVVAVGTPTWWYEPAPVVSAFLAAHDWSGKVVVPFMTNAGWPGNVIRSMEAALSGADVEEPFEVRFDSSGGDRLVSSEREVDAWCARVRALLG